MERFVIKKAHISPPSNQEIGKSFFKKRARVVLRNKLEMFHRVRDPSPT
jgi:hypothetical protein